MLQVVIGMMGCLSALVMFGLACIAERMVTFAAAGPTTFDVTKGGETSHSTCRFAIQSRAQHGSFVPLTDRNVGSASAALQSGVQLWAPLGAHQMKERQRTCSILIWTKKARDKPRGRLKTR